MEYAYEAVAAMFLVVVIAAYTVKNWLDLYKNRCFRQLLWAGGIFTACDIVVHLLREYICPDSALFQNLGTIIPSMAMVLISFFYFQYWHALTGNRLVLKSVVCAGMLLPAVVMCIVILSSPVSHLVFYFDDSGVYHKGILSNFVMFVMDLYLLSTCAMAFRRRTRKWRRRGMLCLGLGILYNSAIVLQFTRLRNHYLLSFYAMGFIIVICYLLFQNMDRDTDRVSGGFSRAGFRKVIREKFQYRQRFSCLFITIQNYQNISSICEENELSDVMREMGTLLRKYGGRRNQFHIHGSDFAVLQKREEESERLYQTISEILPATVRINHKNIPISYGFYMLTLEEAAYDQAEFYKMVASMKKMLREQLHARQLLRYEGNVRRSIDLELHIGRMLKKILQEKHCDICMSPLVDAKTGERHAMEAKIYMLRENGKRIPEGAIWAVAWDMGYVRELGRITLESAMEVARRERILEHGFRKLVVNVTPLHINSDTVIREYRFLSKKYEFPLNRLCLEMTEDMSVPFAQLEKALQRLREEGITLILDQYGDSVCNLQGIMKMPFTHVKISRHMVQKYCDGESDILRYQVNMLRDNGWGVCLEGIDDAEKAERVKELGGISYLQGMYFSTLLTPERIHKYMEEG